MPHGILHIVPTPVGNLDDITLRALAVLREADIILAEDTRTSGILLQHYGIKGKLLPHHKFNEHHTVGLVKEKLLSGLKVALISDAGTPGISDPGFLLSRECAREGIEVQTLPGATACIPALVSSGLPCDRFCFEGFLPVKKGRRTLLESLTKETRTMIFYESPRRLVQTLPGATACIPAVVSSGLPCDRFCFEGFLPQKKGRQTALKALEGETRTMVFYESPYRLVKTLDQFAEVFGPDRPCSVAREISKVHEEHRRGTLAEVSAWFKEHEPKGEIVIVVAGAPSRRREKEEGENEKADQRRGR